MKTRTVHLHIDRLVVDGAACAPRELARALERNLAQSLAGQLPQLVAGAALPSAAGAQQSRRVHHIVPRIEAALRRPNASAEDAAAATVRALSAALQPKEGRDA